MGVLPKDGIEGKFSMPYILARALVDGQVVLDTFTDEAVEEPFVREIARKIVMSLDSTLEETAEGSRPARVTLNLTDGRVLSRRLDFARGTPRRPMTDEELRSKFDACAGRVLAAEQVQRAAALIDALEDLQDIAEFCRLVGG